MGCSFMIDLEPRPSWVGRIPTSHRTRTYNGVVIRRERSKRKVKLTKDKHVWCSNIDRRYAWHIASYVASLYNRFVRVTYNAYRS